MPLKRTVPTTQLGPIGVVAGPSTLAQPRTNIGNEIAAVLDPVVGFAADSAQEKREDEAAVDAAKVRFIRNDVTGQLQMPSDMPDPLTNYGAQYRKILEARYVNELQMDVGKAMADFASNPDLNANPTLFRQKATEKLQAVADVVDPRAVPALMEFGGNQIRQYYGQLTAKKAATDKADALVGHNSLLNGHASDVLRIVEAGAPDGSPELKSARKLLKTQIEQGVGLHYGKQQADEMKRQINVRIGTTRIVTNFNKAGRDKRPAFLQSISNGTFPASKALRESERMSLVRTLQAAEPIIAQTEAVETRLFVRALNKIAIDAMEPNLTPEGQKILDDNRHGIDLASGTFLSLLRSLDASQRASNDIDTRDDAAELLRNVILAQIRATGEEVPETGDLPAWRVNVVLSRTLSAIYRDQAEVLRVQAKKESDELKDANKAAMDKIYSDLYETLKHEAGSAAQDALDAADAIENKAEGARILRLRLTEHRRAQEKGYTDGQRTANETAALLRLDDLKALIGDEMGEIGAASIDKIASLPAQQAVGYLTFTLAQHRLGKRKELNADERQQIINSAQAQSDILVRMLQQIGGTEADEAIKDAKAIGDPRYGNGILMRALMADKQSRAEVDREDAKDRLTTAEKKAAAERAEADTIAQGRIENMKRIMVSFKDGDALVKAVHDDINALEDGDQDYRPTSVLSYWNDRFQEARRKESEFQKQLAAEAPIKAALAGGFGAILPKKSATVIEQLAAKEEGRPIVWAKETDKLVKWTKTGRLPAGAEKVMTAAIFDRSENQGVSLAMGLGMYRELNKAGVGDIARISLNTEVTAIYKALNKMVTGTEIDETTVGYVNALMSDAPTPRKANLEAMGDNHIEQKKALDTLVTNAIDDVVGTKAAAEGGRTFLSYLWFGLSEKITGSPVSYDNMPPEMRNMMKERFLQTRHKFAVRGLDPEDANAAAMEDVLERMLASGEWGVSTMMMSEPGVVTTGSGRLAHLPIESAFRVPGRPILTMQNELNKIVRARVSTDYPGMDAGELVVGETVRFLPRGSNPVSGKPIYAVMARDKADNWVQLYEEGGVGGPMELDLTDRWNDWMAESDRSAEKLKEAQAKVLKQRRDDLEAADLEAKAAGAKLRKTLATTGGTGIKR